MTSSPELVSVIIPAYNASETLGETLASVRSQSHRALDIIVIDDGSDDETGAIARGHAEEDPRIRILRQDNAGAAVARNHGIAEARGALIAPIDADDLWRPDKIARQIQVLAQGGPGIGLVYTWFAAIDRKGRVTSLSHRPFAEGHVVQQMCRRNLVGNGSAPLIPKHVLTEIGGYDPVQPHFCEDLRLYLRIAERYEFALVRDHLTGYRQTTRSMSNRVEEMLHAYDEVLQEFRPKYPQFETEFKHARGDMIRWLFRKAVKAGQMRQAGRLFSTALMTSPVLAGELILDEAEDLDEGLRSRIRSTFSRNVTTIMGGNPGQLFLG
jgi:glycosyltransferase involved in cell wall biosynthesis